MTLSSSFAPDLAPLWPVSSPAMNTLLKLIEKGNVAGVEKIIQKEGAQLARELGRTTPLIHAASYNHLALIRFFLPMCDPLAVDNLCDTALHKAAGWCNAEAIELLLPVSNADARGHGGATPLISAVYGSAHEATHPSSPAAIQALLPLSNLNAMSGPDDGKPWSKRSALTLAGTVFFHAQMKKLRHSLDNVLALHAALAHRADGGDAEARETLAQCARDIVGTRFGPLPGLDSSGQSRAAGLLRTLIPFCDGRALVDAINPTSLPQQLRAAILGELDAHVQHHELSQAIAKTAASQPASENDPALPPAARARRV